MPDVKLDINFNGLAALKQALEGLPKAVQEDILGEALKAGGEVIRSSAEHRIRKRSGETAAGLRVEVQSQAAGFLQDAGGAAAIGTTPKRNHILRFLEFGTKAHEIPKARNRKAGKKAAFGGRVFSKVKHPGTRPQSPLTAALGEDGQDAVNAFARVAWRGITAYAEQKAGA